MNQMNQMMNSFFGGSGFGNMGMGGMGMGGMGMLEGPLGMGHQHHHQHHGHDLMPFGGQAMSPFGPMGGGFPNFVRNSLKLIINTYIIN